MDISKIYLTVVTILVLYTLVRTLKDNKEKSYVNPFFIFLGFIFLYLIFPSFFVKEFRYFYNWKFNDNDIFYSNILVSNISLVAAFMLLKFNNIKVQELQETNTSSFLIKLIWLFIVIYLISIMTVKYKTGMLFFNENYLGSQDIYKIKNIAYLTVTISILYFFDVRRFYVFLPNILIAILDLLEGSRTTALIAIVPIFIVYSLYKKKTYLLHIGLFLSLMVSVGIFRTGLNVSTSNVPTYIQGFGEFRETYLTLPIMISNENFIGKGDIVSLFSSVSSPLIYPLREEIGASFLRSGRYAAKLINRGYGLGSNLITDAIFFGYWYFVFLLFFVIILLYTLLQIIQKLPFVYMAIGVSYMIIFLRLGIREGFLTYVSSMLFVMVVYSIPFIMLNKYSKKFRVKKHVK